MVVSFAVQVEYREFEHEDTPGSRQLVVCVRTEMERDKVKIMCYMKQAVPRLVALAVRKECLTRCALACCIFSKGSVSASSTGVSVPDVVEWHLCGDVRRVA